MKRDTALRNTRTTRSRTAACAFAAFASATFASGPARGADPKTVADALFREGTELLEAGRVGDACPKLAESLRDDPALGTLLYLAACHEKQGLTASAYTEFSSAAEWARRTGREDRLLFARRHRAALEGRVSTVVIHAAITAGIEIRVDAGPLVAAAIGTRIPLDPGVHSIEAQAPGHETWRTNVTVPDDAAALTVNVPPMTPTPVAFVRVEAPGASPTPETEPSGRPPASSNSAALTWGAAGLAGAGVVAGSLFGALTFSARDAARAECPNGRCVQGGLDDADRARTFANVSTVSFAVGLGAAIMTAYLWMRGDAHSTSATAAATRIPIVAPSLSPRQATISLVGRFE